MKLKHIYTSKNPISNPSHSILNLFQQLEFLDYLLFSCSRIILMMISACPKDVIVMNQKLFAYCFEYANTYFISFLATSIPGILPEAFLLSYSTALYSLTKNSIWFSGFQSSPSAAVQLYATEAF